MTTPLDRLEALQRTVDTRRQELGRQQATLERATAAEEEALARLQARFGLDSVEAAKTKEAELADALTKLVARAEETLTEAQQ
jgi:RNase adaptor protein for sRNA GlmZ degradation